ncbi:MAG TPA: hypothetical protein VNQ79_11655 [Blastocatellia bacterium]|nr:hypothetical protein [Blastocatellia bacterium]
MAPHHRLAVSAGRITLLLGVVVLLLTLAGIGAEWAKYSLGEDYLHAHHVYGIVEKFELDGENNLPNWYQSSSILFCAVLLAVIATLRRLSGARYVRHWGGLALIFLLLSLDEAASLHEMLVEPLRAALHTSGSLRYAWVIPGLLFAAGVGLAYLKFLAHLPLRTRVQMIVAGMVFVSGAVGLEMLGGKLRDLYGLQSVQYLGETIAEEFLEMSGILLFIHALTSHLGALVEEVQITVTAEAQAESAAATVAVQGAAPHPVRPGKQMA